MKLNTLPLLIMVISVACTHKAKIEYIDLSGEWTVKLDTAIVGEDNVSAILLPGTTDIAGLGVPNTLMPALEKPQVLRLTRKNAYVGQAEYIRTVNVPDNMGNKPLRLSLERVLWKSQVVIDGDTLPCIQESLTTPHEYVIEDGLSAGSHEIKLIIDNTRQHDISVDNLAHAYTNDTQIMWNGVLGKMTLSPVAKIDIESVQVYPDISNRTVTVKTKVNNRIDSNVKASFKYTIDKKTVYTSDAVVTSGVNIIDATFNLPDYVKNWSESAPNVYDLSVVCSAPESLSSAEIRFGLRQIATDGKTLTVNGTPVFLRGTLECCVFPLTGTPPTDKAGWEKVFGTARQWGLNHLRYHSWCPPEAAFDVADSLGFYLQVELPQWTLNVNSCPSDSAFIYDEFRRISRNYGNHPSLCLMTCGNELQSDFNFLNRLTAYMKDYDPRRLYSCSSFTFEKGHGGHAEPEDQFFVSQWTDNGWVRGQGVFDQQPPCFNKNYASAMTGLDVPLITHEIGQYAVYPNLEEIDKYTGMLDPLNFKAVKKDLEEKGLINLAPLWTEASARLAFILYKEEIERALKTPGLSGYQLLGLQDFPGQGTALVGLVDAFWDSKGIVKPEEFCQFNSPVVPLANFGSAVYADGDRFETDVLIANYSDKDIKDATVTYLLTDNNGKVALSGKFDHIDLSVGQNSRVGSAATILNASEPAKYTLEVAVKGSDAKNSWNIWVYPKHTPQYIKEMAGDIVMTSDISEALTALDSGKKVLLSPAPDQIVGLEGKFVPVFWSPVHFPKQAGTMGMLADPKHPAFSQFPTDMHTDWQWWDLLKNSTTILIDSLTGAKPIISQVDSFTKNRRLASIFEASCGNGSLIFSGMDLLGEQSDATSPERMQLLKSLLAYMHSPDFAPTGSITYGELSTMVLKQAVDKSTKPESIY